MKRFKGYKVSSNNNFVEYILKTEEHYLEGTEYDSNELMQLALKNTPLERKVVSGVSLLLNKSRSLHFL